jgi:hypothetical protein
MHLMTNLFPAPESLIPPGSYCVQDSADLVSLDSAKFFEHFQRTALTNEIKNVLLHVIIFYGFLVTNQILWIDLLVDRDKLIWILGSKHIHWLNGLVQRDKL